MASIEKRGPNSYRLIAETGYDANGKRMKKTKTIKASTKREAQKELAKFVTEVEAGEYIAPEKMTFSTFTTEWEEKYAKKHLGKSTLNTYKHHLNNHILPIFGHIRLDQIKPIQIATFIEEMAQEALEKTAKKVVYPLPQFVIFIVC